MVRPWSGQGTLGYRHARGVVEETRSRQGCTPLQAGYHANGYHGLCYLDNNGGKVGAAGPRENTYKVGQEILLFIFAPRI